MRYQTIDRCTDPLDTAGIILYDGPDFKAATRALSEAKYPNPRVEIVGGTYNGMTPGEVIEARDSYNRLF